MQFRLIAFISCLSIASSGQSVLPALQSLIDAENAFARLAETKSTQEAFLSNLSEDAIVFSKGEAIQAKAFWSKLTPDQSLLFWWPVFADISVSGDFGYTTGPYQWSPSKTISPTAFGYYSTVWKKSRSGRWTVALDLGISCDRPEHEDTKLIVGQLSTYKNVTIFDYDKSLAQLQEVDLDYSQRLNNRGKSFDAMMMSPRARIHRPSSFPFTSVNAIQTISEQGQKFLFSSLGIDLSRAGDMAYAYGKVKITSTKGGNTKEVNGNYLRVWIRTNAGDWKIELDVISP